MVRRRSTVRFRNGAPAQRDFSNIGFHDQVTNQVMRLQLAAGAARRIQAPVSLWAAAIRLNATASDKTARNCQEKVRIRRLPVSVSWRAVSACAAPLASSRTTSSSSRSGWPYRLAEVIAGTPWSGSSRSTACPWTPGPSSSTCRRWRSGAATSPTSRPSARKVPLPSCRGNAGRSRISYMAATLADVRSYLTQQRVDIESEQQPIADGV